MYNHEPKNYQCPFCSLSKHQKNPGLVSRQKDIVYEDKGIVVFMSTRMWPKNPGVVLIIPTKHFENLYDMPDKLLAKVHVYARKIALAMKKGYKCEGISMRQHNEPAGNQEVWHYHMQLFPRYTGDNFYVNYEKKSDIPEQQRYAYAKLLKKYLKTIK